VPRSPRPPYITVADALRERLNGGEWLPGEALPSVTALAETYAVSRSTAARAIKVLVAEGLLTVVPGWGTFRAEH
jgi:DNA-binding GntR family transcriptional regulator